MENLNFAADLRLDLKGSTSTPPAEPSGPYIQSLALNFCLLLESVKPQPLQNFLTILLPLLEHSSKLRRADVLSALFLPVSLFLVWCPVCITKYI